MGQQSTGGAREETLTSSFTDLKPRMKENYRGRAVSLWLNLLPKLEQSGGYQAGGRGGGGGGGGGGRPHGMLTGATWGLVRNTTNVPGVQQISLNNKVSEVSDV